MSMGFYSIADEPAIELHPEHTGFYQDRSCLFQYLNLIIRILIDIFIDFFMNHRRIGLLKNSWFEYQPLLKCGIEMNQIKLKFGFHEHKLRSSDSIYILDFAFFFHTKK